jgi:exodeoxyribonuclease V alpha subunit
MREDDPQGSAILRLASFIRDGHEFPLGPDQGRSPNAPATCRTRCHEITGKGPELLELPAAGKPVTTFLHWWFDTVWKWPPELQERLQHPFAWGSANVVSSKAADLERLFSHFLSSRLLAATRQLATGTEALNRFAGLLYRHQLGRASHEEFIPGEPILMTRNDYLNDVFNGDQGLVLWATTPTSPKPALHAVFQRHDGFQAIPFEAIRHDLEPAYALTVHKSQGSEFNQVFFLLPAGDHPLLTREILYTAVTRARQGVVLIGPREILNLALQRSISRLSRLTFPLQTSD